MTYMTPAEVAAQDQVDAHARDAVVRALNVEARIRRLLWGLVALYFVAGVYGVLALSGVLPVAPWSPAGLNR